MSKHLDFVLPRHKPVKWWTGPHSPFGLRMASDTVNKFWKIWDCDWSRWPNANSV